MSDPIIFPSASPRFGLPFLIAGQAQKEVFVNEAHALADALMHCLVEGEAGTPPATPVDGTVWLVSAASSGEWAGRAGQLACRQGGDWLYVVPCDGLRVVVRATGQARTFLGTWQIPSLPVAPTGGTVIDTQARTTINQLIAALRVAGVFPLS